MQALKPASKDLPLFSWEGKKEIFLSGRSGSILPDRQIPSSRRQALARQKYVVVVNECHDVNDSQSLTSWYSLIVTSFNIPIVMIVLSITVVMITIVISSIIGMIMNLIISLSQ